MISVKEYLSSAETIKSVIGSLTGRTTGEMTGNKNGGSYFEKLLKEYASDTSKIQKGFDKGSIYDLTFCEMLELIRNVRDDIRYKFFYSHGSGKITPYENYLGYVRILLSYFILSMRERENHLEYILGQFTLTSLYTYEDPMEIGNENRDRQRELAKLKTAYKSHINRFGHMYSFKDILSELGDDTTVRDYLLCCALMAKNSWIPAVDDPDIYMESIKSAYHLASLFIVDYFLDIAGNACSLDVDKAYGDPDDPFFALEEIDDELPFN